MPFTSLTKLRVAAAKLPPYLSPSWVTPNVSLNDGLDLAPRIFPGLLYEVIGFSQSALR